MPGGDLKKEYQEKIVPRLAKEFGLKNPLAVPKVEKIVVNIGLGEAVEDKKVIASASQDLATITGQKPRVAKARVAISGFKLRKGQAIGVSVTLRGQRMYDFLEKLFKIVLPRTRDFQGLSDQSFDGRGNYSLGVAEQIVFPEIDYAKVDKVRGLQITIVTNAQSNKRAKKLLVELGAPFKGKDGKNIKNS